MATLGQVIIRTFTQSGKEPDLLMEFRKHRGDGLAWRLDVGPLKCAKIVSDRPDAIEIYMEWTKPHPSLGTMTVPIRCTLVPRFNARGYGIEQTIEMGLSMMYPGLIGELQRVMEALLDEEF